MKKILKKEVVKTGFSSIPVFLIQFWRLGESTKLWDHARVPETDKNSSRPNYKWPWFVLAAVVLGILLMIAWVGYAAYREKQERNFNAPLPVQNR